MISCFIHTVVTFLNLISPLFNYFKNIYAGGGGMKASEFGSAFPLGPSTALCVVVTIGRRVVTTGWIQR
jgi:hypothetical protein